jgi:Zn-dependent protease
MDNLTGVQLFAVWVLPVLFAITVHEVAHGWIASKLGDKTALIMGRLTLNPLKHIDILGTIIVPGILLLLGGFVFGWAKPVPVTWSNLKKPRRDMALVAIAGPITNLLMAFIWACIGKLGIIMLTHGFPGGLAIQYMGSAGILINLMLMFLNLIPIPPLDGSRVISSILPPRWSYRYNRMELFGFFILIALLATGVLGFILVTPVLRSATFISGLFGLPSTFI